VNRWLMLAALRVWFGPAFSLAPGVTVTADCTYMGLVETATVYRVVGRAQLGYPVVLRLRFDVRAFAPAISPVLSPDAAAMCGGSTRLVDPALTVPVKSPIWTWQMLSSSQPTTS